MRIYPMTATPLTDSQISEALTTLPGWERDGDKIKKTFRVDTYMAGLAFACAVGTICEGMNHHPDLFIGWKRVEVGFSTHDAGNKISQMDIDAAAKVESLGYPRS
jgi:4a-hydroxytetrahydrobiopterin dehydratase